MLLIIYAFYLKMFSGLVQGLLVCNIKYDVWDLFNWNLSLAQKKNHRQINLQITTATIKAHILLIHEPMYILLKAFWLMLEEFFHGVIYFCVIQKKVIFFTFFSVAQKCVNRKAINWDYRVAGKVMLRFFAGRVYRI